MKNINSIRTHLAVLLLVSISIFGFGQPFNFDGGFTANNPDLGNRFGFSVAVEGDVAVVGSPHAVVNNNSQAGNVEVFVKESGNWNHVQTLTSFSAREFYQFGFSVAMDGDYLIVGEPFTFVGRAGSGRVHFYEWNATSEQFIFRRQVTGSAGENFGFSVDIKDLGNGDAVAIAGAPAGRNNVPIARAIFRQSGVGGSTWTQTATFSDQSMQSTDKFGFDVAITDSVAIVSAPLKSITVPDFSTFPPGNRTVASAGVVVKYKIEKEIDPVFGSYTYKTTKMRNYSLDIQAETNDQYGFKIDLSDDATMIAAGVLNRDKTVNNVILQDAGEVVITSEVSGATYVQKLDFSTGRFFMNGHNKGAFGSSVSVDSDYMIVGGRNSFNNQGRAHLFKLDSNLAPGEQWVFQQAIEAPDVVNNDQFAFASDTDQGRVIIGSYNRGAGSGKVYVFRDPNVIASINNKNEKINFSIYPNPATSVIHTEVGQIQLINTFGKTVLNTYSTGEINISTLEKGVYTVLQNKQRQLLILN